jgi:hypothetical protein
VTGQHYKVLIKILRDFVPDNTIHEIHEAKSFVRVISWIVLLPGGKKARNQSGTTLTCHSPSRSAKLSLNPQSHPGVAVKTGDVCHHELRKLDL